MTEKKNEAEQSGAAVPCDAAPTDSAVAEGAAPCGSAVAGGAAPTDSAIPGDPTPDSGFTAPAEPAAEPAAAAESAPAEAGAEVGSTSHAEPILPQLEIGGSDLVPLTHVTELAYSGAPEGSGVVLHVNGEQQNTPSELLRLGVLLKPQVPMRQLVAVEPVAAMALLTAFEDAGVQADRIGIGWPHDIVLSEGNRLVATLSTKAGFNDGMFVSLAIDVQADVLAELLDEVGEAEATAAAADSVAVTATDTVANLAAADTAADTAIDDPNAIAAGRGATSVLVPTLAVAIQKRVVQAMRDWETQAKSSNAAAGPWAPFLPAYFDRVPLLGQAVNVCYPNGRVYARGIFVGIDIWGRATVRTRRAGDIEFPAQQFVIRPQSY